MLAGTRASANRYNLVETAKANGLKPWTYLKQVFTELLQAPTVEPIEVLLSWQLGETVSVAAVI